MLQSIDKFIKKSILKLKVVYQICYNCICWDGCCLWNTSSVSCSSYNVILSDICTFLHQISSI